MKKKNIRILVVLAIVLAVCSYPIYCFYNPKITARDGRVVDAITGEPIPGAVVIYDWRFSGFLLPSVACARLYAGTTDAQGKYFIAAQRIRRHSIFDGGLKPEKVLIYKDGYAAYTLLRRYGKPPKGRSFGYDDKDRIYRKKDNLVRLYPWKEGESHVRHLRSIKAVGGWNPLLLAELDEEQKLKDEELLEKEKKHFREKSLEEYRQRRTF
ncbi:MAG: carboxypeptidase-like regulatory domain-containing protein [Planctomycetota bacterium]|jgi:hypothetical protein